MHLQDCRLKSGRSFEAKFTSGVSYINSSVMVTSRKLIITVRLLKLTLAANFFAVI